MSLRTVVALPVFVVTLTAGLAAGGGPQAPAPQNPPAPDRAAPPTVVQFPADGLALLESVRLTLQHSPNIQLQVAASEFQRGVAQEQTGVFDFTFGAKASYDYRLQELTETRKRDERERRDVLRDGIEENRSTIANLRAALPVFQQLTNSTTTTQAQLDIIRKVDPIVASQLELMDILVRTQPQAAASIQASRLVLLRDAMPQAAAGVQIALDEFAAQELKLKNLGEAPFDEYFTNGLLTAQVSKMFRNGISVTPYFDGNKTGTNYKDKPQSADFGGKDLLDLYTFHGGADVLIPLFRRRGGLASGAAEKAAIIQTTASKATAQHEYALSALDTIRAYWNLRAVQDSYEIAQRSLATQTRIRELTQGLIQAGDLPRVELSRVQASEARAQARLSDAARSRHEARVGLATTIGIAVTDDDATLPTARDPFPAVPEPALLDESLIMALVNEAVTQRYDIQAATREEEAGQLLMRSARTDLRMKLDLGGKVFLTALDEKLVSQALDRWVGPSTNVALDFEKPFGNNSARGRLQQREAELGRLQISIVDLRRRTSLDVIRAARSLREAATRVQQAEAAVNFYRATTDAEVERLRAGESTLINVILTEDQQTSALLTLSSARRDLANLIAELRFAVGGLVPSDPGALNPLSLVTVPRVGPTR
jgi:outer membrane protein TolC